MWGGSGWGTLFLPRIGMEVVVQFLDGNPDRPLVVGCVYNGTNKPPVELPAKKTHTTIKTNSSKGGGGFNELRFEDLKGEEKIYVHAQKDLTEEVLNNRTRSVGGNESVVVNGNRFVTVKGAGGGEEGAPPPGQAVDVTGQHRMHATEEVLVNSDKEVYLHVGDTYISIKDDRIELKTTSGAHVLLTGTIIHLNP